jgi:hypothetical protein
MRRRYRAFGLTAMMSWSGRVSRSRPGRPEFDAARRGIKDAAYPFAGGRIGLNYLPSDSEGYSAARLSFSALCRLKANRTDRVANYTDGR